MIFPRDIDATARRLVGQAQAAGMKLATAESCTGGLVAGAITGVDGASAVLDYGFVTYANGAKCDLIGVRDTTLRVHGAVSPETAIEMALGARRRAAAHVAVSVTGVAGPGGGTPEKPVGLVHFACAAPDGVRSTVRRFGNRGREDVRLAAVRVALALMLAAVERTGHGALDG